MKFSLDTSRIMPPTLSVLECIVPSAHDGTTGTFFCHTQVAPDKNFAIVIIMNAANQEQVEGLYGLEAEILKGLN